MKGMMTEMRDPGSTGVGYGGRYCQRDTYM